MTEVEQKINEALATLARLLFENLYSTDEVNEAKDSLAVLNGLFAKNIGRRIIKGTN